MRRSASTRAARGAVAAALVALAGLPAAAQEHGHATGTVAPGGLQIPESMRREHAEIHEELERATRASGRTGEAAREVARVLDPHFRREEQIALPPLGLLRALAAGSVTAEVAAVLPLTDSLKAEMPRMLEEHAAIRRALERLAAVAAAEEQPRYAQLAETIMLHAATEEEITYPAAILVGEYARARLGHAGGDAATHAGATCPHMSMAPDPAMHGMMMQMMERMHAGGAGGHEPGH